MGHMMAARALELAAVERGHAPTTIDAMDYVTPGFRSWYRGGYERLVRQNPAMWGHLYFSSDRPLFNYLVQTTLDFTFCGRIERLVRQEGPDWVVCTHSIAQPRIPLAGRPMATVVTDLYPHRMWLRGHPQLTCVASEWSQKILHDRRPRAKSVVTGIPISPEFRPSVAPLERRVLVTSGGISGGPVVEVVRELAKLSLDIHVVTGWNESLRQSLSGDSALAGVTVHGRLDPGQMAEQLALASLVVAKPGGLTTMEALAVGTPFVVFKPFMIPGQEEQNAQFLAESGAGVVIDDLRSLGDQVAALASDPSRLLAMRTAATANGRPGAAGNVLEALEGC